MQRGHPVEGLLHSPPMSETPLSVQKQAEIPLATVRGEPLMKLPDDLYIPPDALEVFLDAFEGPLDRKSVV